MQGHFQKWILILAIGLSSQVVWAAGFGVELSGSAHSGGIQSASSSQQSGYYGGLKAGYGFSNLSFLQFNVSAASLSGNEIGSAGESAFSTNLMGFGVNILFPRSNIFSLGYSYFPSVAVLDSRVSSEIYREGSGTSLEASIILPITGKWKAGFRFNYINLEMTSKTLSDVTTSETWSRNFLVPTATLLYGF